MARNIEQLPKASKKYRPSRQRAGENGVKRFETKADAQHEDSIRRLSLLQYSREGLPAGSSFDLEDLQRLASHIEAAESPASSVCMRKHRDRIGGQLYALMDSEDAPTCTFTLLPRGWKFAAEDLHKVDPGTLLEQQRQMLLRAGAGQANGWLFLGLHGEHEPIENQIVLHEHGAASGEMIQVIDRLRKRRAFKGSTTDRVRRRVRRSQKPLINLPDPLTYTVQSFWPARPVFEAKDGSTQRLRDKQRIAEPWHTEVLLWLDRWRLRDTTLLMGMKVGRSGFRPTKTYIDGGGS